MDALHERQVDHDAAVRHRPPRDVMPAAPDGDLQVAVAGQRDGIDDVGGATAAGDNCRPPVDQPVVDPPSLIVPGVARCEHLPREAGGELGKPVAGDRCR
jgi:hypothetical protein